ncbi:MAG TPA: hypothetical protein VFL79_07385, partial [Terriglobia bacterium]|nr:hypothetical protein [Terriglobia bacterium]
LVVVALALAFIVPDVGSRWFGRLEWAFGNLARQKKLSVLTVGLTALTMRAALLPILPLPVPGIGDEFGYLLLSDTFAHWRLTNPTSPMWVHFENSNILWHPTYTSKYWPAQGMMMAVGQVLMGHPFWGVWLSIGLMCAAITWMLQAWVGERWALLGGFLALIRFGTFNYWANSYWGGTVTAMGGALVLGALPRLKQQEHRLRNALLMGLGFAVLANSRPYEGLFLSIPVAVALLVWLWKLKRPELGAALRTAMVPLLAVLALTVAGMGYYFWRTTGSPFNTPCTIFEHTYDPAPVLPWQPLKPFPAHNYPHIRPAFMLILDGFYNHTQTPGGLFVGTLTRFGIMGSFYLGPIFILPLLLALGLVPDGFSWKKLSPNTRFLMIVSAAVIFANLLPIWYMPHYTSPATCAILALVLIAMRRVQSFNWRGKPSGQFIIRAVPSICVLLLLLRMAVPGLATNKIPSWCYLTASDYGRADVQWKLRRYPGQQLAIVRHNPSTDMGFDGWVYNRADLNSAKIIWAHDMGREKNQELIDYYKSRHVWLVDADSHPPKLVPYSEVAGSQPIAGQRGSGQSK